MERDDYSKSVGQSRFFLYRASILDLYMVAIVSCHAHVSA